jgi:Na+/proline symporter
MIAAAGLFTENIYRPWYPGRSTKHYLWVARIAGVVIVIGGVVFAFWISNVVEGLTIWLRIAPMMGISIWMALFWRRLTVAGAWAGTFTGFGVWFITNQTVFISALGSLPGAQALNFVVTQGSSPAQVYEPWKILFYTLAAALTAVLVSLSTKPVNRKRLDRFHDLMRTPIGPDEKIGEPCTLPPGVEPAQRSYLVRRFGFEIIRPSTTSVIGFLVGWVAVGFLVGGFFWFVKG